MSEQSSQLGPNKQEIDPDRVARGAKSLLIRCAAMFEAMAKAVDERGERISFKVIDTPDGRKNVWSLDKPSEDIEKLKEFAQSLRTTAERMTPLIDLLTPSRALRLHSKGMAAAAHASAKGYEKYQPGRSWTSYQESKNGYGKRSAS